MPELARQTCVDLDTQTCTGPQALQPQVGSTWAHGRTARRAPHGTCHRPVTAPPASGTRKPHAARSRSPGRTPRHVRTNPRLRKPCTRNRPKAPVPAARRPASTRTPPLATCPCPKCTDPKSSRSLRFGKRGTRKRRRSRARMNRARMRTRGDAASSSFPCHPKYMHGRSSGPDRLCSTNASPRTLHPPALCTHPQRRSRTGRHSSSTAPRHGLGSPSPRKPHAPRSRTPPRRSASYRRGSPTPDVIRRGHRRAKPCRPEQGGKRNSAHPTCSTCSHNRW
mmetsp:Transcript_17534/g.46713  ORF Transcript_17534/g.46713 Transcript_17534/m.46713 type:complete len:280 (+) Transcript_17534:429-1268(+)